MSSAATRVHISVIGEFAVIVDGQTFAAPAFAGRRPVELVQLLSLADGRTLLRDQVLESLWPQLDPAAGAANLRKAAHHARRALGQDDAVVLRGGSVSLFPDRPVAIDVDEFEAAAAQALTEGDPRACSEVIDGWPGELLPTARYEEWAEDRRRHVRAHRIRLYRAAQRWADLIELEPTDEAAYQALMRQAIEDGNRVAGVRWFSRLRENLARELGVTPDVTSQALYEECLEGLSTAIETTMVGRDRELTTAQRALATMVDRGHGALVVRGPAGIGKSVLCRELAAAAAAEGWSVKTTHADEPDLAYRPLVALIEEALLDRQDGAAGLHPHARAVLAAMTPMAGPADSLEGPLSRHQVVGAVQQLLRPRDGNRGVLVVLDDAHRADEASLEALAQIAMTVRGIFVILAARSAPSSTSLERLISRLRSYGGLHEIDLLPLDHADASDLVHRCAATSLPADLVARIVERSEGNPFVLAELARGVDPARPDSLPTTVSGAILDRLVDVDADTMDVLRRLAVAADDLSSASVEALTGDTGDAAAAVLDRALEKGVLVVERGRYRFRHDLVRHALVEHTAPHQRAAVHRDVARRLARIGAPAAVIARHWLAGDRPGDAVEYLLAAAEQALSLGAFADARHHLSVLLQHEADHATARRLDAEALDMMGEPGALAAYDLAIHLAEAGEADDLIAMRALAQLKLGDPPGALAAISGAEPMSVMGRLSEALTYAGAAALGHADPATGSSKAAECRRLALESGDAAAIVVASWAQAAAAHSRGELHDSVLTDLRDTSALPHLAVRVFDGQLCITQRFLYGARPYDDVISFASALADEGARLGAARGHAFGVTLRGEAELLCGRLDEAESDLVEGGRLHRAIGGATGEALALQRLAELAIRRGDRDTAAVLLSDALDLARVTDIGFHLLDRIYGTLIELSSDKDQARAVVAEAEAAVRGPLETCPGCRITFAVPAAIACAQAGDLERAHELEKSCEWLAHVVMRLPAWNAAYDEVRGHVALAEGHADQGRAMFAAAAEGFAAAGQPYDRDRCAALAAG